jgi:hypothetical protein
MKKRTIIIRSITGTVLGALGYVLGINFGYYLYPFKSSFSTYMESGDITYPSTLGPAFAANVLGFLLFWFVISSLHDCDKEQNVAVTVYGVLQIVTGIVLASIPLRDGFLYVLPFLVLSIVINVIAITILKD